MCTLLAIHRKYLEVVVGGSPPDRPAYLLGESFGGVLALAVAQVCSPPSSSEAFRPQPKP